ncbi:MAG: kelch repeat-containing protein, partial [Candidatus Thorarchaeota archaeon]
MSRRGATRILACFLMCLMLIVPFVGLLDSTFGTVTEKNANRDVQKEMAVLVADEMPPRMSADLVYDSESDKVIFFGGSTRTLVPEYDDTWSYDFNSNTWKNMQPTVHPPATDFHQMAYHSGQDKIVLFGGHVSGTSIQLRNHDETWVYDCNSNTWTNMNPVLKPPPFCGGTMAYDSESDLIVLFGGYGDTGAPGGNIYSVTWTYNLTSNTWTDVTSSSQPYKRSWATMAYDSESDLIVFFGGVNWTGYSDEIVTVFNDTWTYDVDTNTWTEITTEGPNIIGDFAYDSESDRVLFFGGAVDWSELARDCRSETWAYDTNTETWENMNPNPKPGIRCRGELVYDSESDRTILFQGVLNGGWANETLVSDCWSYDYNNNLWNDVDSDWQQVTPVASPGMRCGSPLVYDDESDRMVIFSGWQDLDFDIMYNDTWSYDYNSNTWTNMSPVVLPHGRGGHCMAYSKENDVIVMFGGSTESDHANWTYMDDTWVYDLNANTWTNMSPISHPSPRVYASMAYDNESDVFVLFGGATSYEVDDFTTSHETWIYNLTSNTWTDVTTGVHPLARYNAGMTYNCISNRLLLGGGDGNYPCDIWEYQSTTNEWTEVSHITAPRLFGFTISYDLESQIVVAAGGPIGASQDSFVNETWTFDQVSGKWTNMFSLYPPPARSGHSLAYDVESDRTIMFGGLGLGELLGDTWAYNYRLNDEMYLDFDNDGLMNYLESQIGTDYYDDDTDSDLMPDGWEHFNGLNPLVDDADGDLENDGLLNLEEFQHGTDPNNSDCDDDSVPDGQEVHTYGTSPLDSDSDDDLMPDGWEINFGLDPLLNDTYDDLDDDGLLNYYEYMNGTYPNNNDTDSDQASDGWEVQWNFDPLDPSDGAGHADDDGLPNYLEE